MHYVTIANEYAVSLIENKKILYDQNGIDYNKLQQHIATYLCWLYCLGISHQSSVTRFDKILPFWHNFKSLGQIFVGLFSILQKFNLTFAKMGEFSLL